MFELVLTVSNVINNSDEIKSDSAATGVMVYLSIQHSFEFILIFL